MPKHGKRYEEARKLVDRAKIYTPPEACELIKQTSYAKFDATVDVHMKMGVDPRHADQQVRSVVLLPNGTGKKVRIMVFAEADAARAAMEAGADYVGSDDYVQKIQGGWMEFDVAVATPQIMGKVGRLGKVLGPRGLMPSPKTGTIVPAEDIARLIKELRLGRVEFRVDKTANIHVPIGKVSFTKEQLFENFAALMEAVVKAKPSGAKGQYVRKVVLSATMSPGIKIDNVQAELLRAG
jgi:large subunit ribosomal protein L1